MLIPIAHVLAFGMTLSKPGQTTSFAQALLDPRCEKRGKDDILAFFGKVAIVRPDIKTMKTTEAVDVYAAGCKRASKVRTSATTF